jgi:hypothetical protein
VRGWIADPPNSAGGSSETLDSLRHVHLLIVFPSDASPDVPSFLPLLLTNILRFLSPVDSSDCLRRLRERPLFLGSAFA